MLHLHLLELTLQLLVLLHLCRVLVIDAVQVLDDFGVLGFHLGDLASPLLAFLVFLLLEDFALLLNALLLELKHLNLVVDVASFDVAQLELVFDLVDAVTAVFRVDVVLAGHQIICIFHLVLLEDDSFRSERLLLYCLFILLIIAAIAFDVLVVGKLLGRWCVALSLPFHAAIVSAGISSPEGLLSVVISRQRLISSDSHGSCSLL